MSRLPNSNSDNGDVRPTEDRPPSTPSWVKVSGIITIVLVLLVVIMMLFGGDKHGPGRHIPKGDPAEQIEQEAPGSHAPSEGEQTQSGDYTPTGGGH
jgi:hypothetical protein